MASQTDVTELLMAWGGGDQTALEKLMPLVEAELHRLAHRYMRHEGNGHILQTTALINETFLRLVDQKRVRWQNRAHFFGVSAQIMRRVLLNVARDQKRLKRGGGKIQLSLSAADLMSEEKSVELLDLDEAMRRLAAFDERKSSVIELRYFGGLSVGEVAEVLDISTATVMRDWDIAKAWLARELGYGG